jgi:hypothetical protein
MNNISRTFSLPDSKNAVTRKSKFSSIVILATMLLVIVSPSCEVESQTPVVEPAFTTPGAFFALSVSSLEESTQWYSEKLGLKLVTQVPKQNKIAINILKGGGLIVELLEHEDAVPPTGQPELVHGIIKAGVVVEDYQNMLSTFNDRGITIFLGPFPSTADQSANVLIKDNSGNIIQFFEK